jgi:CHAT domain-containing protein/tetratricopeptide (TPR) repeat protein
MNVVQVRSVEENDELRVAAERAFAEGERLRLTGRSEALRQSIPHFEEALRLWQGLKDRAEEATTQEYLGWVYDRLGEKQKALAYYSQCSSYMERAGSFQAGGRTSEICAELHEELGDPEKAVESYLRAVYCWETARDYEKVIITRHRLCLLYRAGGETQKALECYEQALLYNITSHYMMQGQKQSALAYFKTTADYVRTHKNPRLEATTLNYIGRLCQLVDARELEPYYYDRSVPLWRALGETEQAAKTLEHIAIFYEIIANNPPKALEYRRLYYQEAQPLMRVAVDKDHEAYALFRIGELESQLGEPEAGLEHLAQALNLFRAMGNNQRMADVLHTIGYVNQKLGRNEEALKAYSEALPIDRELDWAVNVPVDLSALASLERERGNLTKARALIEEALDFRERLEDTTIISTVYDAFAYSQKDYELYIELLIELEEPAAALLASERSRARVLLKMLKLAQVNIRQGVPPKLIEEEKRLKELLAERERSLADLLSREHTAEEIVAAEADIENVLWSYNKLQVDIRFRSRQYTSFAKSTHLNVEEIQREALDSNTLLLEYTLGEKRSFLWAVTRDTIAAYELPPNAEIEAGVRDLYAQLSAQSTLWTPKSVETLARLSGMLLEPVAALLENKRLVIVGDGFLQYIPFGVLPEPSALPHIRKTGKVSPEMSLITGHEIVNLPSASTLVMLRRDRCRRQRAPQACVIIADPVFNKTDLRFKKGSVRAQSRPANEVMPGTTQQTGKHELDEAFVRIASEGGIMKAGRILRLVYSGREAVDLYNLTSEQGARLVVGFEANRTTVMRLDLSQFRIIHFATHGIMNGEHPELSGLVLSLIDEQGTPQNGFLRLYDIYNLNLAADIVVLSACHTALGKEIKGEGLFGLTRGFMYAGAERVVASLWAVDDEATAELMKMFYEKMLGREQLAPAAALREAQLAMQKRWPEPYFWAGFILQGDWESSSQNDAYLA